jgi:hypothetical protein
MMDPNVETLITAVIALITGGGATYGVQKIRGGAAPAEDPDVEGWSAAHCNDRHEAIREDMRGSREEVRDSIHALTTEVRVGFETVNARIATVARAERDAHEDKHH